MKRATFYGDSIMASLAPVLAEAATHRPAWAFTDRAIPRTAPCDMVPLLRADMASAMPPGVVAFEDIGNASSPCMGGVKVGSAAYFAKYQSDFAAMFAAAHPAHVVFVVPPPMFSVGTESMVRRITTIGCAEATKVGATIVTAARDAVALDDCFAWSLGAGILRQSDGIHLTPLGARLFARPIIDVVVGLL